MTGLATSGVGAGTLVGPFIADRLITALDWRHSYLILGSIVLVAVIAAAQLLRRDPVQVGQVPYGANYESKNIADVDIFRPSFKTLLTMRQFWLIFSIFFCVAFINFTVYVHIVPHATDLGIAPAMAASIM